MDHYLVLSSIGTQSDQKADEDSHKDVSNIIIKRRIIKLMVQSEKRKDIVKDK